MRRLKAAKDGEVNVFAPTNSGSRTVRMVEAGAAIQRIHPDAEPALGLHAVPSVDRGSPNGSRLGAT